MRRRSRRDHGATAVEYGLLIALIVGLAIGAIFLFGGTVFVLFDTAPVF
jgi:Flp pilus assembly pilin Flp